MRNFHSLSLIAVLLAAHPSLAKTAKSSAKQTVHQARGLKKGLCYTQISALTCDNTCILALFPQTQKQLVVEINRIPKKARSAMGYFFLTEFRVLNEAGTIVELLSWKPVRISAVRDRLAASSGLIMGRHCKKN